MLSRLRSDDAEFCIYSYERPPEIDFIHLNLQGSRANGNVLEQPAAILTLLTKPLVVHPVSYSVFSDVYRASLVAYAVKNLPAMWDT